MASNEHLIIPLQKQQTANVVLQDFTMSRPDPMKDPVAPFFLAINQKGKPENPVWYQKLPWVKTRLANFSRN